MSPHPNCIAFLVEAVAVRTRLHLAISSLCSIDGRTEEKTVRGVHSARASRPGCRQSPADVVCTPHIILYPRQGWATNARPAERASCAKEGPRPEKACSQPLHLRGRLGWHRLHAGHAGFRAPFPLNLGHASKVCEASKLSGAQFLPDLPPSLFFDQPFSLPRGPQHMYQDHTTRGAHREVGPWTIAELTTKEPTRVTNYTWGSMGCDVLGLEATDTVTFHPPLCAFMQKE